MSADNVDLTGGIRHDADASNRRESHLPRLLQRHLAFLQVRALADEVGRERGDFSAVRRSVGKIRAPRLIALVMLHECQTAEAELEAAR